ncbi:MAG TPA: hypothetical protein VNY84_07900 [Acidimicrobiales bacterium]|jgi:hypothetical protein|nr:hypothetical protein [Acidimicrobiales bacterium]
MSMLRKAIVAVGVPIAVVVGLAAPSTAVPTKVTCGSRFQDSVGDELARFNPTNAASVDRFGPVITRASDVLARCLSNTK